jgi:predicted nucleic-acid-binding protein
MRAVDTNVLIRYLMPDDPVQRVLSEGFFDACRAERQTVFIPVPVLCEFMWVMDRGYGQTKSELIAFLEKLFRFELIRFDCESAVRDAFEQYRRGLASLPDYLIGELAAQAGCRDTVTFDRALRGTPGFTIL